MTPDKAPEQQAGIDYEKFLGESIYYTVTQRTIFFAGYRSGVAWAREHDPAVKGLVAALEMFLDKCTDEDLPEAFRLGREALAKWERK